MPCPCGLVVKNGSNMRVRVASSMPMPVSVTVICTYSPGFTSPSGRRSPFGRGALRAAICSVPPFGHRIARVDGEVDDRLFDLHGVGEDLPQVGVGLRGDSDVLADHAPDQHDEVVEHRREVDLIGLQHLPAAEREQLLRQRRGALGGAPNLRGLLLNRRLRRRVLVDHAGVAENRGEHVVEVVRDAAGELADRLHLLRLGELPLEAQLFLLRAAFAPGHEQAGDRNRNQQRRASAPAGSVAERWICPATRS